MSTGHDSRFLKRRTLLVAAGELAARQMTAVVADRHGPGETIGFNADALALDDIVQAYFAKVDSFKVDHDFRDGDLINFSKIAGLFTIILLEHRDAPLFRMSDRLGRSAYAKLMMPFFIYVLVCSILSLDMKEIDDEVENNLMWCLRKYPEVRADAEWLFWSLKLLQIHYGNPALSAS